MRYLITGGSGFIGSNLIRLLLSRKGNKVINVDKVTYAGNTASLNDVDCDLNYKFYKVDICDKKKIREVIDEVSPNVIMHLAAESHVDRSISCPDDFIKTNIFGTYSLLEATTSYWQKLHSKKKDLFRFHHISTDEVYGDLSISDKPSREEDPYLPSSPYSASKASSDHLVRSWFRTYGLPVILTNCSNNYGPFQFPEKFIPKLIVCGFRSEKMPVYGDGKQIRDWLYVDDHTNALLLVAEKGVIGETYNIGGGNQLTNIDIIEMTLDMLTEYFSDKGGLNKNFHQLVEFVADRPGHDRRYAIDCSKIKNELGWEPLETLENGLKKTISWYASNTKWWKPLLKGKN
tara:strand:+ start:4798 stop:5835 length:1038 start_codon:yes stop_codon:yes gene_type:complete